MSESEDNAYLLPPTPSPPTPITSRFSSLWGCLAKGGRGLAMITVEPIMFLYILGVIMMGTVTTNLMLEKICRELAYPEDVCSNLTSHPTIDAEVQKGVTTTLMYLNLITSLPSLFFALFLGSWSDRNGRKLPLILPVAGTLIGSLVYSINAYYRSLPSTYILFAGIPIALAGGFSTLMMASFAYISDITKLRSRTTRIALVDLSFSLASPLGMILGDFLYYRYSYLGVYWCGTGVYILAFLYGMVRIKDTRVGSTAAGVLEGSGSVERQGPCGGLCDVRNVKVSFVAAFRKRPDKGRAKILVLLAAMCLVVMEFGSSGMDYLYTKHLFGWSYDQYVHLSVTKMVVQMAVTSVALPVLSYRFQVNDAVLVLLGCSSKVLGMVIMGLSPTPAFLYISALVSSIGVLPAMITRSLISKVVPHDELGKVFAVLASFEAVVPLGSGPMYTALYNGSISAFPGAIYFLTAGLYVFVSILYMWLFANGGASSAHPPSSAPTVQHIHADEIPDLVT